MRLYTWVPSSTNFSTGKNKTKTKKKWKTNKKKKNTKKLLTNLIFWKKKWYQFLFSGKTIENNLHAMSISIFQGKIDADLHVMLSPIQWGKPETLILTLLLLNTTCPVLANSVQPDQLASEEANWSGSALFVNKYVNFYQKSRSSNLIGWKLEVGVAS